MNFILKTIPLFFFFALISLNVQAQFTITNGNVTTCSGTFTDSGGSGTYGNNENFTYTICADGTGGDTHVSLVFEPLGIDASDLLCFYDGDNTSAPALGCSDVITNTETFVIQASAVNPSGCVTITFTSDGATNGDGWNAAINCVQQCQTVTSIIMNSTPPVSPPDTGYIDICPGDLVVFQGSALYPQNNFIYAQSDNTSSFEWDFGDGTSALGPNVQHQYNDPGGYIVQLTVTDVIGCVNTNFISQRIRVSGPPEFNLADDISPIVCVNDTISVYTAVNDTLADISIIPGVGGFQAGGSVADSVCVPDGTGEVYTSVLELSEFSPGQTLNDINDLLGICVNMEHSFLGDLEIIITCPTGQSVILHEFSNFSGGGYWLGNPIDNNAQACQSPANVGTGEEYCWTPNAVNGTWLQSAGLVVNQQLPPDDYSSFQDLNGLLGCALNGQWTISIEDNWGIDDGVIFSWNLQLNEDIFPNLETFNLDIVNAEWLPDPSILINNADSMIASPQFPGNINYVFEATDNFGCVYDTTVNIQVLPQTDPACYNCTGNLVDMPDVTICDDGETAQLTTSLENVALTSTTFQDTPNAPFSNFNTPPSSPLTSVINVSGLPYNFIDASSIESICLNITHPSDLDVIATLVAPNGTTVELTNGGGGVFGQNYTDACFTPTAVNPITGGTPPYTGDWIPNGDLTTLIGSQANGNWTLQVSDQYPGFDTGVLVNWNITFSLSNSLTWTWSPTSGLSCTDCPNPIATPTSTTPYTVTATDTYGCTFTENVTVSVINCSNPCTLAGTLVGTTDASCSGSTDGTATFSAAGQVGSVTYVMDGTTTQIDNGLFTGLTDGPHQLALADGNNCTDTIDFVINTPNPILITLTPTDASCNGGSDGAISSTVTGGDGNFTYSWNTSETTDMISSLTANDYTIIVTDGNNCTASSTITVNEPTALVITPDTTHVSCFGGNDGTATANTTGGTGTYSYLWSDTNAQTTLTAVNLTAGTYTVTVTDVNLCTTTMTYIVTEPSAPLSITSITQTNTACAGDNLGEATVVAAGGTAAYTYLWSSGGTSDVEGNLAPGDYTVTITDQNLCTISDMVTIIEYDTVVVSITRTNVSCFSGNDGSANANATGGTAPYNYLWSDPNAQTSQLATGLTAGDYTVTVTDINGCTATNMTTLTEPTEITHYNIAGDILCNGEGTGFAAVFVDGGVNPFSFEWSTGVMGVTTGSIYGGWTLNQTTGCLDYAGTGVGNSVDTICITMDDGNNNLDGYFVVSVLASDPCGGDFTDTDGDGVCDNNDPDINDPCIPNNIDINNNGVCDFNEPNVIQTVYMEVVLGTTGTGCITLPSTFDASNTAFNHCLETEGHVIGNLTAGDYTVTFTDANGCTISNTVTVTEPDALLSTPSQVDVSCFGGNDGQGNVVATGGVAPYTYLWSDAAAQTTDTATGLLAGPYTVTVTDTNGCTITNSITITEPATAVQITSLTQTYIGCNGTNSGEAEVIATGGTNVFTYNWSSGGAGNTTTNLAPNIYTVTVTDSNGCTATDQVTIVEYGAMSVTATSTDVSCFGGSNGTAEVTLISGGAGTGALSDYTYAWSGTPQTTSIVTNLGVGSHTVTVTDNEGCSAFTTVTVNEPTELTSSITNGNLSCSNTADGFATVTANGGTLPYSYLWDVTAGSSTSDTVNGLFPGGYNVTVTDANGCNSIAFTFINPVLPITIDFDVVDNICYGEFLGSITANVNGGTEPYTYIWSTGDTTTTNQIDFLPNGIYELTISDANGCTVSASTPLFQPDELTFDVTVEDVTCFGDRDGSIIVTPMGGTFPYTYSFNNEAYTGSEYSGGLFPGYYSVNVQDANGCIVGMDSVLVGEPLELQALIYPGTPTVSVPLGDTLALTGDAVNPVGGFTFEWDALYDDSTLFWCTSCQFPLVYTLENDRYTVTVTDDNGCTATEDIEVIVPRDREVFVPSGFTPNGDNVNDVLMVHGTTGTRVMTFRVYDRWGELVFRADDYEINSTEGQVAWAGDFKGKEMNSAVFVWYVEVIHIDGRTEAFEGNTTLLR